MTFCYSSSFNVGLLTTETIQLATSGKSTFSVNISTATSTTISGGNITQVYNHWSAAGLGSTVGKDPKNTQSLAFKYSGDMWPGRLQSLLRTGATTAGWAGTANNIVVTFDTTTLRYTISYSATFTITFGGSAARIHGYTGTLSGASSYVAPSLPYYILVPVLPAASTPATGDGIDYEPEDITVQGISAQGVPFSLSRGVTLMCRDWTQQYESKANTVRGYGVGPFCHQTLFESCRGGLPFIVDNGFGAGFAEAFVLRGDSANFGRDIVEMATPGNDAQYHVNYRTYLMGRVG